jgi:hypothetical protein
MAKLELLWGESNQGPNTKVKEDTLRFPTFHSRTSTSQRIKSYDFRKMTGLLKTSFLYRLLHRKKIQLWGCSDGILPLSWIQKTWTSLPDFYPLLIQPYTTHGLEDTEFWRSNSLLIFVSRQNYDWSKLNCLGFDETLEVPNIITVANSLSFLMVHNTAPNG